MTYASPTLTEITLADGTHKMVPVYANGHVPDLTAAEIARLPEHMVFTSVSRSGRTSRSVRGDAFDASEERWARVVEAREWLRQEAAAIAGEL